MELKLLLMISLFHQVYILCIYVLYNTIQNLIDGSRVIVAVGNRVLLYKSESGDLIESLRGSFVLVNTH